MMLPEYCVFSAAQIYTRYIIGYFFAEDANGQFTIMNETQTNWLHGNVYKREFLEKKRKKPLKITKMG